MNMSRRIATPISIVAAAALGVMSPAAADEPEGPRFVGFGDPVDVGIAGPPIGVAAGDIDGDGIVDLAVAAAGPFGSTVTLWIGTSDGAYIAQSSLVSIPTQASAVRLADIDGDGRLDLIVTDPAADAISVRWGQDGIGFESASAIIGIPGGPRLLAVGDSGVAGDLNIWTGNDDGSVARVRYGGGRSFGAAEMLDVNAVPSQIATGDLDGDGDDDLVVGLPSIGKVRLVRSTDDGPTPGPALNAVNGAVAVAAGQAIGDAAFEDIAMVTAAGEVRIWESAGEWYIENPLVFELDIAATAIRIADLDNDGDGDVIVTDGGLADEPARIRVIIRDESGFADPMALPEPLAIQALDLIDLDGNSSLDFVGLVDDGEFRLARSRINVTDVLVPGPFDLAFPADGTTGLPRPEDLVWEGATARLRWTPASGFTVTYRVRIADNPAMVDPVVDMDGISGVIWDVPDGTLDSSFTWYWTVDACTAAGITTAAPDVATFTMTCREDLDGDGEIGFGDVLSVLTAWGQICGG